MADFFASEYGWTDDYIMENVPLDRFFIRKEIIEERQRQELKQQLHIALIPQMEQKAQKKILDDLEKQDRKPLPIGKGTKTDIEGLKRLKQQQEHGT